MTTCLVDRRRSRSTRLDTWRRHSVSRRGWPGRSDGVICIVAALTRTLFFNFLHAVHLLSEVIVR